MANIYSTPSDFWISPKALTISLNALDDPQYLQVSVLSGTVIMAYKSGIIDYDNSQNYRKWKLEAYNTFFETPDAKYVYAQLAIDSANSQALIIYSDTKIDITGKEENSEVSDDTYYYIYLGTISAATNNNGERTPRFWEVPFISGNLATDKGLNEETLGEWAKMFRLNRVTDLIDVLKGISSAVINSLSIGKELIFNGRKIKKIDISSDNIDNNKLDDESIPTTKLITNHFLSKLKDDKALGHIDFDKGISIGDFIPGIIGAIIDQFGDGEMGSLVLRKFLSVPELRFNRAIVYKGKQIISPGGGCLIESFTLNGNGTWTITPKLEEGEPLSQDIDDIMLAYWHDKDVTTGAFKGFREMKFRVISVDSNARTFVIAPKPDSLSVPAIAMTLAQVGNFTNTERQTYTMIDSTLGNNNITFFDNCNTWDVEENQEKSWFGKKKGRTVSGIDASDYSAVLKHVIMTGLIFQIDEISGELVRVPCDKESYKPGDKCAYYDRVPYDGGLWLCVNEKGTSETPKEGHPDWLNAVKKGDKGGAGIGISSSDVLYYLSTSPTALEDGNWQTDAPVWQSGKYMWTKTRIVYTDNSTMESTPVCITGGSGKGVSTIVEQYYLSTSSTSLTGGSWKTSAPTWQQGSYVWTRSVVTYTDNTTTTTDAVCVSGSKGDTGDAGESIKMLGHWNSSMRPVPANCMVSYAKGVYLSLRETSQAPVSTLMYANGSYFLNETGGYILASDEVNEDWELILENGKNGVSILFQGSFPAAPANPKDGWSYYNTSDKRSYVYQGGKWYLTSVDGKDGKGFEWIFTRTKTNEKPIALTSEQQDDYVPSGWTDDPVGCTSEYVYEWTCKRVKKDGVWGAYSTASIFNMYSFGTIPQWSKDNVNWHDTFQVGDLYIRYSSDGGKTWTDGARAIGETGKDGPYTDFEFAVGESDIQAPVNGWMDAPEEVPQGKYLWMRTQYIVPPATVNPNSWAYSRISGTKGVGIASSDVLYYLSTSPTDLEDGSWQTNAPTWQSGKYMWTKTKIVYTDNSTMESTPVCITGNSGKGVYNIVEQYYLSTSPNALAGGSWSVTSPSWKQGYYIWTRSVITYTDNTTNTTDAVCVSGSKGNDGESIKMLGHWNSSMRPVPANCMVSYAKGIYLSLRETNQAPVSTLMYNDGGYITNETGGYILASNEVNEDWELILENGKNGVSILFQGSFPTAPNNPEDGWSYYNTSDKRSYVYQSGKWYLTSVDGKDGKGFEWIFTRTKTDEKPIASSSEQQDDYVPVGWTDDPVGCTSEYVYEWTCKRVKKDGVWGAYSTASIFNMYSFGTIPQWSKDNVNWHDTFQVGDLYIRYSSDGGKTWTDGARAIGETGKDGPYTDFEFAVGESEIQAPVNGWGDAPAEVTPGKYLWMRTQYIVPPATVNPSAWSYSRLTGTTGSTGPVGIIPSGHWQSANTPYKKTSLVTMHNASFVALVDTSKPPVWLLKWGSGPTDYLINNTGGYIPLTNVENNRNTEWLMITPPPVNGNDSTSYWLTSPVSTININSVGSPSPSSVLISCKKKKGAGTVSDCSDFFLAARKYNGSWLAHVSAVKSSSIAVPAVAGYTQFSVRAYNSASEANSWVSGFVAEIGIGVSKDGATGDTGPAGSFPRDRGEFVDGTSYYWSPSYRDKIIYPFDGIYYNFLVANFGATVTKAPTSPSGDGLWESMGKYKSIATDTLFADGANVARFMFKNGVLRSQDETDGVPNLELDGKTGKIKALIGEFGGYLSTRFNNVESQWPTNIDLTSGMNLIGDCTNNVVYLPSADKFPGANVNILVKSYFSDIAIPGQPERGLSVKIEANGYFYNGSSIFISLLKTVKLNGKMLQLVSIPDTQTIYRWFILNYSELTDAEKVFETQDIPIGK